MTRTPRKVSADVTLRLPLVNATTCKEGAENRSEGDITVCKVD